MAKQKRYLEAEIKTGNSILENESYNGFLNLKKKKKILLLFPNQRDYAHGIASAELKVQDFFSWRRPVWNKNWLRSHTSVWFQLETRSVYWIFENHALKNETKWRNRICPLFPEPRTWFWWYSCQCRAKGFCVFVCIYLSLLPCTSPSSAMALIFLLGRTCTCLPLVRLYSW